ncbi:helicase [Strigomonas culicis]|uniref:Helicase n=1 Tax=Strigomonas culicis TaxID=28005 RepID=S9TSI9_9TRYP|nr:helicase [Strigomonas culicis]|eukprot:EPY21362.1 helicase [Strigomonas culicis]
MLSSSSNKDGKRPRDELELPAGEAGGGSSTPPPQDAPHCSPSDITIMANVLRSVKIRWEDVPCNAAPPTRLPPWQCITLSALSRATALEAHQRASIKLRRDVGRQVRRYHAEEQERAAKLRQEQLEARARLGARLNASVERYWRRRGDVYQQLLKTEFDVLKRKRDAHKQEDMLRETEELTKKLLDSILKGEDGELFPRRDTGKRPHDAEEDEEMERHLSLLDTLHGKRPLRDYQRSALKWMIHLFENNLNGILADEMGLGKTVQTIALLCYFAEHKNDWGPHLVVVPTTVVLNWKAEFQRWAPGLKVLTYIGSYKERQQLRRGWYSDDAFHVCVTSYNIIVKDRSVFRRRPWGFLVLDEAHQVKNFMSKKWQSLFDLQAQYRLLLTGTPLQNSIMELWSLFHFLLPFASAFRSNDEFKEWFSNPLDEMITGKASLNENIVRRLQALLRPFMLRRLKRDVECQLPTKTERVVMCNLSRRQRSLYDDYMQLAETKQKLSGDGGTSGVLGVLLALRKVCNHPDMFEERPTQSPFVLGREAALEVTFPRSLLLRHNAYGLRHFMSFGTYGAGAGTVPVKASGDSTEDAHVLDWVPCTYTQLDFVPHVHEGAGWQRGAEPSPREALLRRLAPELLLNGAASHVARKRGKGPSVAASLGEGLLRRALEAVYQQAQEGQRDIRSFQQARLVKEAVSVNIHTPAPLVLELKDQRIKALYSSDDPLCDAAFGEGGVLLCPTIAFRVRYLLPIFRCFAVYVPAAVTARPPALRCALPVRRFSDFRVPSRKDYARLVGLVQQRQRDMHRGSQWTPMRFDSSSFLSELWPLHVRRCFGFPDKRLLIHDCGKLQFLQVALKKLRLEGHRMLIFTQFTHMLNILERFLALVGIPYLRLDGSTKAELRQQYVERFNEDEGLTCMILSTRSGGIGLNLTGADTVIFYDSDWNPTMDLQAQDRCHRIGQTRPVTIYRLISTHTVEENILQKARERKKLNNLVIRGGQFHSIAGVEGAHYESTSEAYAALAAPVNLRSFFHDLDEDATATVAAPAAKGGTSGTACVVSAQDMLTQMRSVEDDEDRLAQQQVEDEMNQRELEDAEETVDAAEYDGPRSAAVAASQQEEALFRHPLLAPAADAEEREVAHAGMDEESGKVLLATRKRQREILKPFAFVDQLVALQYGVCHPKDAEVRYESLVATYTDQLEEEEIPPFKFSVH